MGQSLEAHIRKLQDLYWSAADPEGRGFVPLADAYRKAGDFLEARRILREGMDRHPDFASGHVVSGWVSLEHSRPEEAEASFKAALDLDPRNIAAMRGLAGILMERGQVETALGFLQDLLQEDPIDADLPARIRDLEERIERSAEPRMSAEYPLRAPTEPTWGDLQDVAEELDWSSATLQPDVSPWGEEVGLPEGVTDWAVDGGAPDSAPDGEEMEHTHEEVVLGIAEDQPSETGVAVDEGLSEDQPSGTGVAVDEGLSEDQPLETGMALPGEASGRDEDEFDGPWVAEDGVPVPDIGGRGDTLVTSTLGEIYFRQGYLEWAEEVFRTVLDRDPGNEALRDRLLEVRALRQERDAGLRGVGKAVPAEELEPAEELLELAEELEPAEELLEEEAAPVPRLSSGFAALGTVVPVESLAPVTGVPVEHRPAETTVPVDLLAPETIVPIELLAPDAIVPIDLLAPETIVPIELLAPDAIVPIELLAPDAVVSIESLAPDSPAVGEPGTAGEVDGVGTGGDRALDAFQAWLDTLQ